MTIHAHRVLLRAAGLRFVLACAAILPLLGAACDDGPVDGEEAIVDVADEANARPVDLDLAAVADEPTCDGAVDDGTSCDDDTIERKEIITSCYCGIYNGGPLYVGVDCSGYPGTHVCCAEKCGELKAALDSQH